MIVSCFTIILLRKKEVITFCLLLSCFICGCTVPLPLGAHSLYVICDCGISMSYSLFVVVVHLISHSAHHSVL